VEPLLSIIVPVYKVEPYLRKCLDSIVGQTYQNFEVILVDDGSPDNCGVICDEYAARDERIVVIHKGNGGVSSARNAGLARAAGEWIGWVDSDDWIEPDMYEYLLENAKRYGADIAVCGRYEVYEDRKVFRGWECPVILNQEQGLKLLLEDDLMQNFLWDKLWRRNLFDGLRFPEGRTYEDMAVMHRLFERAERIVCLPEAKYNYFHRAGSIVSSIALKDRLAYCQAVRERYEELAGKWPEVDNLLLGQCAASAMGIWCTYFRNPREARRASEPELKKISVFCAPHIPFVIESSGMGLAGRFALRLVAYPTWWAFALARLVSRLYERKHGRPL